jgi:hypothetical protein
VSSPDGTTVEVIAAYQVVAAAFQLVFPEPNEKLMHNIQQTTFEIVERTRFIERRSRWTGRGIQRPPRITAYRSGRLLEAKRHGPNYSSNGFRAYLIDLGETLEPGERVSLTTETHYVDEAGSFERFLSYVSHRNIENLNLSLEFADPPDHCRYYYIPETTEETETEWFGNGDKVYGRKQGERTIFDYPIPAPSPRTHKLVWDR